MAGSIGSYAPPQSNGSNRYSADYPGSRDEWIYRTARAMADRYAQGDQSLLDNLSGATGNIGQPDRRDFQPRGSDAHPLEPGETRSGDNYAISEQTFDFFVRYLEQYGDSDPYVRSQYGQPPSRTASFGQDPNSNSQIQAGVNATSTANNQRDNATSLAIAQGNNATSLGVANIQSGDVRARIESDQRIAFMDDATRRYISEGDWGTQRYVAEMQERGQMDRLQLELGMRDKELAQRAQEAKDLHHREMLGLVMEVAKYDSQLAAEPRNWIAYASWLGKRDMVINGLTLSMAADMVPEAMVNDPQAIANAGFPASGVAAAQTAQVQAQGLVTGASGGSAGTPEQNAAVLGQTATPVTTQAQAQGGPTPVPGAQVGGVDLNSTDYGAIARQLLGIQPGQSSAPALGDLQGAYDATNGKQPGFQAWRGPTTNALGMQVDPQGHKTDYRQFSDLLPGLQDMKLAAVSSVGKWQPDFLKEMDRARPKGGATGVASWG